MKKIVFVSIIVILVCILVGCASNNIDMAENTPNVINVGVQTLVTPELILRDANKYEELLGADVNIVQFDTPADLNKAFISGDIDFGYMGSANAAAGISNGVNGQVIWLLDVIGDAEALVVRDIIDIDAIGDLNSGKRYTIAVPYVSTAHFSLLKSLQNSGIDISHIEILDMRPNDIYAAWERGDIDMAYVWNPVLGKILDNDGKIVISSKQVADMGAMTADVVMVRTDFAKQYPDTVVSFIKAQEYAVNEYYTNRDLTVAKMANILDIEEGEVKKQVEGFVYLTASNQIGKQYLGTVDKKGELANVLKQTADFLCEIGSLSNSAEQDVFDEAVSPVYLERILNSVK